MDDETEVTKPSLDDLIDQAYDTHTAEVETTEAEKPELKTDATGRAHGADGRFVPKEPAAEASPPGTTEAAPAEASQAEQPAPQQLLQPHARWNEARKTAFSSLSPEAQKLALEIQAEHEANFTRSSQEFSEFKRNAEPVYTAIQPLSEPLSRLATARGLTVPQLIGETAREMVALNFGDTVRKHQAFVALAQQNGVDIGALARGQLTEPAHQQPRQDNELSQLRAELAEIKQAEQRRQTAHIEATVEAFINAKDANGKPLHPHYTVVEPAMAHYITQKRNETGQFPSLEEAYAEAVKPIEALIAGSVESRQAAIAESNKASLDKAKKAAPVKTNGSQPTGVTKPTGLDAILGQAMERAGYA